MNGTDTSFLKLAAESLKNERFTLVDVGCSGGLEPVWRVFGDRLRAIGFDASASECRRLAAEETNPDVHYVAGFVDIPPDHPFTKRDGLVWGGHAGGFYEETSSRWTMELRAARLNSASDQEKLTHNQWQSTELADPKKPLYAPQVLEEHGFTDVDFLKIDVDGPDFRILNSFDGLFEKLGLLGIRLEVNMFGGAGETTNIFHNTDRFMRQQGYALVRLDTYIYSKRALPARFLYMSPTNTVSGRLFQGEAYYARVPASAPDSALATSMTAEKLIKLAAIFSVWNQPDGAAEILVTFRDRIAPLLDVDAALDRLAAQTQAGKERPLPYRDYMALFATDSPEFYPPPSSPPASAATLAPAPQRPTFFQRLKAAWYSVSDWTYIEKLENDLRQRRG